MLGVRQNVVVFGELTLGPKDLECALFPCHSALPFHPLFCPSLEGLPCKLWALQHVDTSSILYPRSDMPFGSLLRPRCSLGRENRLGERLMQSLEVCLGLFEKGILDPGHPDYGLWAGGLLTSPSGDDQRRTRVDAFSRAWDRDTAHCFPGLRIILDSELCKMKRGVLITERGKKKGFC